MFAPKRLALCLVLITVGAACVPAWRAGAQPPRGSTASADSKPQSTLQCVGVSSCTAAACHNAPGPQGSKRSEYTTWLEHDPHARAYAVLADERSQVIVRNYRGSQGGKTPRAETDRTCLACHALSPEATGTEHAYLNLDGVSCESCHGRAEKWLSIHYLPDWQTKTDQQKLSLGMTPTKNLISRGKLCAECHIGSPKTDLNHDLYAAGHPPLYYEYAAFLGSMPKHWSEREEKARYPDLEMRVWVVGQIASAKAAMELLAHRSGDKQNPWPELAEYNCFACHHDLQANMPPQLAERGTDRMPGTLRWGSWFTSMLPIALGDQITRPASGQIGREVETLRSDMEKPAPRRDEVAARATRLASQLDQALLGTEDSRLDRVFLDRMSRALSSHEQTQHAPSWEEAAQLYLARAAVYYATFGKSFASSRSLQKIDLEIRRKRLQFPQGFLSLERFDSEPPGGTRQKIPR